MHQKNQKFRLMIYIRLIIMMLFYWSNRSQKVRKYIDYFCFILLCLILPFLFICLFCLFWTFSFRLIYSIIDKNNDIQLMFFIYFFTSFHIFSWFWIISFLFASRLFIDLFLFLSFPLFLIHFLFFMKLIIVFFSSFLYYYREI